MKKIEWTKYKVSKICSQWVIHDEGKILYISGYLEKKYLFVDRIRQFVGDRIERPLKRKLFKVGTGSINPMFDLLTSKGYIHVPSAGRVVELLEGTDGRVISLYEDNTFKVSLLACNEHYHKRSFDCIGCCPDAKYTITEHPEIYFCNHCNHN